MDRHKRILQIWNLYVKLGTMQKVGKKLGLSSQRINQMLLEGDRLRLFEYKTNRERFRLRWTRKIPAETIKKELLKCGNLNRIKKKYKTDDKVTKFLLNIYHIDTRCLRKKWKIKRDIEEYQTLIKKQGYSPTSTEMRADRRWNALWSRIWKTHGCSLHKFRSKYGIKEPVKYKDKPIKGKHN